MSNPNTTLILENVWKQLNEDFDSDILHLGMDELNKNCACAKTEHEDNATTCLEYVTNEF